MDPNKWIAERVKVGDLISRLLLKFTTEPKLGPNPENELAMLLQAFADEQSKPSVEVTNGVVHVTFPATLLF